MCLNCCNNAEVVHHDLSLRPLPGRNGSYCICPMQSSASCRILTRGTPSDSAKRLSELSPIRDDLLLCMASSATAAPTALATSLQSHPRCTLTCHCSLFTPMDHCCACQTVPLEGTLQTYLRRTIWGSTDSRSNSTAVSLWLMPCAAASIMLSVTSVAPAAMHPRPIPDRQAGDIA